MNATRHADLARQLIAACRGLERAARFCRVSKSRLQRFQDETSGQYMTADVIADLEQLCGEPIYSRVLAEGAPPSSEVLCFQTETLQTTELAAKLQGIVRRALEDDRISHAEGLQIDAALAEFEDQVRELRAARDLVTT